MAIKTFTTGEVLTAADTNTYLANSGLVLVKSTTVGSGVANVTVSSAFSATYDNYIIQYVGGTHSTSTELRIQLDGATGADYQSSIQYLPYGGSLSGATTTTTAFGWCGSASANNSIMNTTLYSPFLAKNTFASTQMWEWPSGIGNSGGRHTLSTSYTGFVVIPAAGTMTGGTIIVYGFRKG